MTTGNFIQKIIVGAILILSLLLSSCSTSKKSAINCPDISINKIKNSSSNHKKIKSGNLSAYNRTKPAKHFSSSSRKNKSTDIGQAKKSIITDFNKIHPIKSVQHQHKAEFLEILIASTDNNLIPPSVKTTITPVEIFEGKNQQDKCDTIMLKSGSNLVGKVEEIGQSEIKYRKCNNLSGPIISIAKSSVSAIMFSNGSHETITEDNPFIQSNSPSYMGNTDERHIEGFGIAGMATGLVGLFVASIPLGIIAIVFGAISLSRIKKHPKQYKGKGFAIASLILGLVDAVVMLIVLASA